MLTLGIETSFDDVGVALFDSQFGLVLSINSLRLSGTADSGGIVPQAIALSHTASISSFLRKTMTQEPRRHRLISSVACTLTPGLILSLAVGVGSSTALAHQFGSSVAYTKHTRSHITSVKLANRRPSEDFAVLVVSGKTTALFYGAGVGDTIRLKTTADDPVGEILDKTARAFFQHLKGSGGVLTSRACHKQFVRPRALRSWFGSKRISCSQLKMTALVHFSLAQGDTIRLQDAGLLRAKLNLAVNVVSDLVQVLVENVTTAVSKINRTIIVLVGGVSSSAQVVTKLNRELKAGVQLFVCPRLVRSDNGAMVAHVGFLRSSEFTPASQTICERSAVNLCLPLFSERPAACVGVLASRV